MTRPFATAIRLETRPTHGDHCIGRAGLRSMPRIGTHPKRIVRFMPPQQDAVLGAAPGVSHRSRRRKLRAFAINTALLGGSCLVALLAGELVVRLAAPQQLILKRPDLWRPDSVLGWVHRPLVNSNINTGERTVVLRTDDYGHRIGEIRDTTPAVVRILLLGDSYMEALQVPYEQSLAGLLESNLPLEIGLPVTVENTAVGGWDPDQYLIQARHSFSQNKYDAVLVSLYVGNDIISRARSVVPARPPVEVHHVRLPRSLAYSEFVDALLYPVNDWLEARSHLFLFVKNRLSSLRVQLGLSALELPRVFLKAAHDDKRWQLTAALCDSIAAAADTAGTPVLFFLIPTAYQLSTESFNRYLESFNVDSATVDIELPNRMLEAAFAANGRVFIDLLQTLREAALQAPQYGTVDPHFSAAGHHTAYTQIAPALLKLLRNE